MQLICLIQVRIVDILGLPGRIEFDVLSLLHPLLNGGTVYVRLHPTPIQQLTPGEVYYIQFHFLAVKVVADFEEKPTGMTLRVAIHSHVKIILVISQGHD